MLSWLLSGLGCGGKSVRRVGICYALRFQASDVINMYALLLSKLSSGACRARTAFRWARMFSCWQRSLAWNTTSSGVHFQSLVTHVGHWRGRVQKFDAARSGTGYFRRATSQPDRPTSELTSPEPTGGKSGNAPHPKQNLGVIQGAAMSGRPCAVGCLRRSPSNDARPF